MALADRLASILCGPPLAGIELRLAELVGGERDGGLRVGHPQQRSARRISARPSALEIGYSRSSDSIAQNGAGLSRTACTQGAAIAPRAASPALRQRREQRAHHLDFVAIRRRQTCAGGGR
jgi:hypothetical protein